MIVSLSVLVSCTGTKLVSEWKDDQYQGRPANVFVIAVSNDRGPRSLVEDEFVRQLKARGTGAVASYTMFSADAKVTKEDVLSKVRELGADAILVMRFLKKEAGDTHTPLRRYAVPQGFETSWDAYYGYGGAVTDVGVRDVSYDYDVITMETTLYDAATRRPLWSALSDTAYQGGAIKQIKPFTSTIIRRLAHEKLVP
jgi:uncharacterized protein YbjQ (UPF0145 family)